MLIEITLFTLLGQYFGSPNTSAPSPAVPDRMAISIQGQLRNADPINHAQYRVQLVDASNRRVLAEKHVSADGAFHFGPQPTGFYEIRAVTIMGVTVASREFHSSEGGFVVIPIPAPVAAEAGPIAAQRLNHKIPKPARKHFDAALKLAADPTNPKLNPKLIDHLRSALQLDPDYFEAHSLLASVFLDAQQSELAKPHLDQAHRLDPVNPNVNVNLALWHLLHHDAAAAEQSARQCLRSAPNNPRAHYLLAHALAEQRRPLAEIKHHLEIAAPAIPAARDLLKSIAAKS
jgi:tetratricopeptide (TPR) repeat protein